MPWPDCAKHDYVGVSRTQPCPDCWLAVHVVKQSDIGLLEIPEWWKPARVPRLVREPDGWHHSHRDADLSPGLRCTIHGTDMASDEACLRCVDEDEDNG